MSETISFRVPDGTLAKIDEKTHRLGYSVRSLFLRDLVVQAADADAEGVDAACAPHAQEVDLGKDETCPALNFARKELCARCPYREQPVVSRGSVLPKTSTLGKDHVSEMVDESSEKSRKS